MERQTCGFQKKCEKIKNKVKDKSVVKKKKKKKNEKQVDCNKFCNLLSKLNVKAQNNTNKRNVCMYKEEAII